MSNSQCFCSIIKCSEIFQGKRHEVLKSTKNPFKISLPRKSRFIGSHSVVCRNSRFNLSSIFIVWYTKLLIPIICTCIGRTAPGSIPGGVTGYFSDIFPSDRTMTLVSTQPQVKMSTGNIPGGKGGRCVRLTTSPPSCAECHEIWEPKPPGTLWATPGLLRDPFYTCIDSTCSLHVMYI
jgi:hypothetical protein